MIEEEMKIGPKGQVVIPKALRKALGIHPGSKVIFRLEGNMVVLEKPEVDTVILLESIAKKGRSISRIPPHLLYEEDLTERA